MSTVRIRERILKSILIIVVGLPFAVLFWMQPEIPKPPDDSTTTHTQNRKTQEDKSIAAETPATDADSTAADKVTSSVNKKSTTDDEPPTPTVDELLAESRRKVADARAAFQRALDRADTSRFAMFGGDQWSRVQQLQQQAELSSQPTLAVEYWQQAQTELSTLISQLPLRQKASELRRLELAGDDRAFLVTLRDATKQNPNHFDSFWQQVANWNHRRWYELCQSEIQQMTPDDPGFSEIWLAIADDHEARQDTDAARTAGEKAWANVSRMTHPTRAVESALDSLQRIAAIDSTTVRPEMLDTVASLLNQVRDGIRRAEYLADLSGLAHARGDTVAANKYSQEAETVSKVTRLGLPKYNAQIIRCRAMAFAASPDQIFDVCVGIPKYNGSIGFDPFPANTMAYAHAALAAVRSNDRRSTWRGLCQAEAQQLDVTDSDSPNAVARQLLAQVDLAQKNWRRAIITANNLADPSLRASIIFRVMQAAPAEVPANLAQSLLELRPTDRGAIRAIASFLPRILNDDRSLAEWLDWIAKRPQPSVRAAAYLALARRDAVPNQNSENSSPDQLKPLLEDARSLLETATATTNTLQEPLERANAHAWIAVCWHRLQKPASYAEACERSQAELFQAWQSLWRNRPAATTTLSRRFYLDQSSFLFENDYREKQDLIRRQHNIAECSLLFAEVQAFHLHDPRRALDSVLDAARASHSLTEAKDELRIRLRAIVEAIHRDCELPTGLLDSALIPSNSYLNMITDVPKSDLSHLKKLVQLIESDRPGFRFNRIDCAARGYAEVARLAARQGELDDYRAARRSAISLITSQNAIDSIQLLLMEADALAGEFDLALRAKRPRERLPLYGTVAVPLSTLCVELCRANRLSDAEPLLAGINEPFWKLRAMHAIAAARLRDRPSEDHLEWATQLEDPFLRVAAYCGLALREPRLW